MRPPATANSLNEYMVGIAWRAASPTICSIRLLKKASLATRSAPVRAWTRLTKAASISRCFQYLQLYPDDRSRRQHVSRRYLRRRIARILKKADRRSAGHQLVQQRESLGPEFTAERVETR